MVHESAQENYWDLWQPNPGSSSLFVVPVPFPDGISAETLPWLGTETWNHSGLIINFSCTTFDVKVTLELLPALPACSAHSFGLELACFGQSQNWNPTTRKEKEEKTPYNFWSTHHPVYFSEISISMPIPGLKGTKITCPTDFFSQLDDFPFIWVVTSLIHLQTSITSNSNYLSSLPTLQLQ